MEGKKEEDLTSAGGRVGHGAEGALVTEDGEAALADGLELGLRLADLVALQLVAQDLARLDELLEKVRGNSNG